MRLFRPVFLLLALGGCITEPSYEGRICDELSPCPGDLQCIEGRCALLAPADAGESDSGPTRPDAGETADATSTNDDASTTSDATTDPDATTFPDAAIDAGMLVCQPGETRSCYSGQPEHAGVGICREGTQTCAGADFGPCVGDIAPRTETCNSLDDNCDNITDNGCPSGFINFVAPYDTPLTGWLPFGDTWAGQGCNADDVIVGFFGHYADYLNEIGEHCSTPMIVPNTNVTPHTYSLSLMPSASATPRGGVMGSMYNAACGPGSMVVAISGLSGSWIDQLSFTCAEFELYEYTDMTGARRFRVREVMGSRTLVSLQAGGPGGTAFDLACPADLAASVRLHGALGLVQEELLVTTLGLGCSELDVILR